MREASIFTFEFKFLDKKGQPFTYFGKLGRISRDGLILHQHRIFFQDIHKVEFHKNKVIVVLVPYPTISEYLSNQIIKGHNCIVLQVKSFAFEVKAILDRRCAQLQIEERLQKMTKAEIKTQFKKVNCPHCDSIIDLTGLVESQFVHCQYCQVIFDKYTFEIPGNETYKICPENGYYDRIQSFTDIKCYYLINEKAFSSHTYFCSDSFAEVFFKESYLKNLSLLIGFVMVTIQKFRSLQRRNPYFKDLYQANILAQQGEVEAAGEIYDEIMSRTFSHPGIHYNYGLAYLQVEDQRRAHFHFQKSLQVCSNYEPTKNILRKLQYLER
ncbi:tetratricopeptide repeat protein [Rapidithrix thailandica]|uniref:Tetratricopeptide repeat protein n=1 Tax=Rapidithrix thailandica TaxID=413964 RepID=A0AAW9RZ36_9BACT